MNFSEILIEIQIFSFKKMHLKVSSAKSLPFCLGLNVLIVIAISDAGNCLLTALTHCIGKLNILIWYN